jgi:hypothetical protein
VGALSLPDQPDGAARGPGLIDLQPGAISYRAAGDFTRGGKPAEAPIVAIRLERPLAIMRHQVTAGDYQRCVLAAACQPLAADVAVSDELPAVKVSWRDADAYAAWLSRGTGQHYRLPTDEEWAFAAGSRYRDDGVAVDANNPAKRWLARFEREAARQENPGRSEVSARTNTACSISRETSGSGRPLASCAWHSTRPTPRSRQPHARATAACASSKASIAPMSAISSAMPAPVVAQSAYRQATLDSGWCASPAPGNAFRRCLRYSNGCVARSGGRLADRQRVLYRVGTGFSPR